MKSKPKNNGHALRWYAYNITLSYCVSSVKGDCDRNEERRERVKHELNRVNRVIHTE